MVRLARIVGGLRLDLALGLVAWLGIEAMAHPTRLVAVIGDDRLTHGLAFKLGTGVAFIAFAGLTLRWVLRLARAGRKLAWDPELRAIQGTVMAEFALVLPIVLLLLGTVIQIALIAHAAVIVRYAAFVAARSAIVSFEAETRQNLLQNTGGALLASLQVPPFPEWVDPVRPEQAAYLVLATLSPRADQPDPRGAAMQDLVEAQGEAWQGGHFARRMAYARAATSFRTIRDRAGNDALAWHDSFAPLIPLPDHAVQPARQMANAGDIGYLLPAPPSLSSLIPSSIPITLDVPIPSPFDAVVPPISFTFTIPVPGHLIAPLVAPLDQATDALRTGSAWVIRQFAESPANIDPFAPKEVEITLKYDFELAIPSLLQLAPGVTVPPRGSGNRAFRIQHEEFFSVRMQSTGGRRSILAFVPVVPDLAASISNSSYETVDNTPLYWRPR